MVELKMKMTKKPDRAYKIIAHRVIYGESSRHKRTSFFHRLEIDAYVKDGAVPLNGLMTKS